MKTSEARSRSSGTILTKPPSQHDNIAMEGEALKVTYSSFGLQHVAYIEAGGLACLTADRWALPVPVMRHNNQPDGTVIGQKIGYASRMVSGRFLKIGTVGSGGDLLVSWPAFLAVVRGERKTAMILRE